MIEQERKFKLKYLPDNLKYLPDNLYCLSIKQAYLMLTDHKQLRVRISDNHFAFICYKSYISTTLRNEYEYEIPIEEGQELYDSSNIKLEKKRYRTLFTDNNK